MCFLLFELCLMLFACLLFVGYMCRKSLKIIECLLFETDDLILRKNEKHVILCLLEVARRGAKFGMLAPMLVQMERQIDREIAAEIKANNPDVTNGSTGTQTDVIDDGESENEDDDLHDDGPMLMYGPQPQIITNDLKSLDEMSIFQDTFERRVRDLVEKCTCPSQFPMVRVSEGKYRIGDTKVLIFVRILRSHVMVRVGGGWDTLSHYLDKHDPCRCRAQHRSSVAARLIPRTNNQSNGIELHKAHVIFERSPPTARRNIGNLNHTTNGSGGGGSGATTVSPSHHNGNGGGNLTLNAGKNNRTPSPTPQRKFFNQLNGSGGGGGNAAIGNAHHETTNGHAVVVNGKTSPSITRRSMSPSPRRLHDMRKKQNSLDSHNNSGPKSLPLCAELNNTNNHVHFDGTSSQTNGVNGVVNVATSTTAVAVANVSDSNHSNNANSNKFDNISDNGSEISDEGYRSLGVIQSNQQKRESLHSQASIEDAENNARLDPTSSDSQMSPVDEAIGLILKNVDYHNALVNCDTLMDAGPQSLPAIISTPIATNNFEQSGVFITDDEITVDMSTATAAAGDNKMTKQKLSNVSKIPRSPIAQRRRSIDNSKCNTISAGSLQDLTPTGLPVFNRKKPVYRSVRKTTLTAAKTPPTPSVTTTNSKVMQTNNKSPATVRDVTNTWNGRGNAQQAVVKKRPTINADTFTAAANVPSSSNAAFERNCKARHSQIVYDSNGRRVRSGCSTSLNTSPVKNHNASPLAQQLLEAASSAKNDAQILERMKTLLSRYSTKRAATATNSPAAAASSSTSPNTTLVGGSGAGAVSKNQAKKPVVYEDFTSAWVHSNGNLERSSSCSPPTKTLSKRSSAASSTESTHSRDLPPSVIVSPRRVRQGVSKIPGPLRQHTELY